ncbi:MAG TPA: MFS transporter [Bacteroidota bacterium]
MDGDARLNSSFIQRLREYLGLNRNVSVLSFSTLGLALGEELWLAFLPKYLVALGASGLIVGFFASTKDLLDGLYQYPGGWLADRFGRKSALTLFTGIAIVGYVAIAIAPGWEAMFPALVLVMAWKSGAFSVSFTIIGDALPAGRRGVAFSVISILQRLPRVIGAPLGGLLIASIGILSGVRAALAVTILLAVVVLISQQRLYLEPPSARAGGSTGVRTLFAGMPSALKHLLAVECIVRTGEALAASFIVLYVIDVMGIPPATYGLLFALQQAVAISLYIPSGKIADVTGRRPIIALTFLFFAVFPLAVFVASSPIVLVAAFVLGGLKEFGEPARKSLIVDMADPERRGSTVGMYYTIRNLSIVPAGILGGFLWQVSPEYPLLAAFAVGLTGVLLFIRLSRHGFA